MVWSLSLTSHGEKQIKKESNINNNTLVYSHSEFIKSFTNAKI